MSSARVHLGLTVVMLTFLIALFAVNINLTSATPLSMLENDYYYDQLSLSNGNNPTNELLFTGRQHPATTLAPTLYGASSYDAMDASASNDSTLAMVSSFESGQDLRKRACSWLVTNPVVPGPDGTIGQGRWACDGLVPTVQQLVQRFQDEPSGGQAAYGVSPFFALGWTGTGTTQNMALALGTAFLQSFSITGGGNNDDGRPVKSYNQLTVANQAWLRTQYSEVVLTYSPGERAAFERCYAIAMTVAAQRETGVRTSRLTAWIFAPANYDLGGDTFFMNTVLPAVTQSGLCNYIRRADPRPPNPAQPNVPGPCPYTTVWTEITSQAGDTTFMHATYPFPAGGNCPPNEGPNLGPV